LRKTPASGAAKPARPATDAEVRRLGLVFLAAALILSALSAWKARAGHWPWQVGAAAFFAGAGLCCLALGERARGIHLAWTALGDALGRIVSPLVLGVLYFLVVTPFGLASRLRRRDALGLKPDPKLPTYWRPPASKRTERAGLLRQY